MTKRISLGISSCPNDTYIFHALLEGLVPLPYGVDLHMADVEELNALVREGKLEFSKLSVGVVPEIMHNYALLHAGAALGWGCGPLVVGRGPLSEDVMRTATVAIPGRHTTANLLLDLHGGFQGPRQEMLFDAVIPAVAESRVDCGVIIHEGRFTYEKYGLHRLLDMGEWWETQFAMPLPLGAIAVRRDVEREVAEAVQEAIRASLHYANAHPEVSREFVRRHAQEMQPEVTASHIKTFVTDYSLDLGAQGREAINLLVTRAVVRRGGRLPDNGLFL